MNLTHQLIELIPQKEGIVGMYKQIEKAARLCYKSEDKITEDSYKKFINMLSTKGHYSPFEHGTIYLRIPIEQYDSPLFCDIRTLRNTPWTKINRLLGVIYLTTNYRAVEENCVPILDEWICDSPTAYHDRRYTFKFITSLAMSRELNRHRCHSICEESTRYCNYSQDKFNGEISYIEPIWFKNADSVTQKLFLAQCVNNEEVYLNLIKEGYKPQYARDVLNLSTKTELMHTAFESDWKEFIKLRTSQFAHPQMIELATKVKELLNL